MDGERGLVDSHRLTNLAEKFHDKRYRDGYVAAHTRSVLARQVRNFRGDRSQAEYAAVIGKRQTVVSRLESPAYGSWTLRTMLEIARKENVAVLVQFVDFATFLKYTGDLSDKAMHPPAYSEGAIDELARENDRRTGENALKALFSKPPLQEIGHSAQEANAAPPRPRLAGEESKAPTLANDSLDALQQSLIRQQG